MLMRDKYSGVIREVSESYLRRWPDDYEAVPLAESPAVDPTTSVESGGEANEGGQ